MKALALSLIVCCSLSVAADRVLVAMSSADSVDLKNHEIPHATGFFQSELTTPAKMIEDAGWQLDFATPKGGQPPAQDMVSYNKMWFGGSEEAFQASNVFLARLKKQTNFNSPFAYKELKLADLKKYDGLYMPGGHAPMQDMWRDSELGRIQRYFHHADKTTGAICHAPVALLASVETHGWIYEDYKIAVFSNEEEKIEEEAGHLHPKGKPGLKGYLKFYVADRLRKQSSAPSNITHAKQGPWKSHFERDRELVTGQNPFSDTAVAENFVELLVDRKLRKEKLSAYDGKNLASDTLVDVYTNGADWKTGYTTLFVGKRKHEAACCINAFKGKLEAHVNLVASSFRAQGLRGYVVFFTADNEYAYMNWESKPAFEKAMQSNAGKAVAADAGSFMENVLFKATHPKYPPKWLN